GAVCFSTVSWYSILPSNATRFCADAPKVAQATRAHAARVVNRSRKKRVMASLTRRREWSYLCGHPSRQIRECQVNRRTFLASLAAVAGAGPARPFESLVAARAAGGRYAQTKAPLPPVSWTCPMHAEVVDDQGGACPICGMALVPVRLELVWSCQLHLD